MPRRSNEELSDLCQAAWRDLTASERASAKKFAAKNADDAALTMDAEHLVNEQPQLSLDQAYRCASRLDLHAAMPGDTPEPTPEPAEGAADESVRQPVDEPVPQPEPVVEPAPAVAPDVVPGLSGWMAAPPQGDPRLGEHDRMAMMLRSHPGLWHTVGGAHLTLKRAHDLASHIRTGRIKAYRPAGSYAARAVTTGGVHVVVASYAGEES
ncbi:hypothetical protein [Bifidobacterium samirii]|uniref:Uncharacterized protein n=1 Tax=Bifidobacterium samirii TaxID=2306974 RepID=A0A430FUB8_9BIFI|nr:hypothetical protein [Bifidobacterium samirii]RSX56747.1 hypothetical protein D2E24_1037 [Bifidobacterium samirii]